MGRCPIMVAGFRLIPILGATSLSATPLYLADSASHLLRVDVATAQVEGVFDAGVQFTDIAFAPAGQLYGITADYLYEIDPTTGWSNLIGPHGFGGLGGSYGLDSLAFGSNSVLYAAGNDILISIDPLTGAGTRVGSLSGHRSAGDLAIDSKGRLVMTTDVGWLVEVDTDRGGVFPLGRLPYSDIYALATDPDGTLYGLRSTNQILRIDSDTGHVAALGTLHANTLIGRAWGASFPVVHLPEPATVLLLILGTSVASLARRKSLTAA
jgi:hypothetical protein